MTKDTFNIGNLRKAGVIRDTDIDAAVDAFFADPKTGAHMFGESRYSLDLAEAVKGHRPSQAAAHDKTMGEKYRRTMVRTAILLRFPIEP